MLNLIYHILTSASIPEQKIPMPEVSPALQTHVVDKCTLFYLITITIIEYEFFIGQMLRNNYHSDYSEHNNIV